MRAITVLGFLFFTCCWATRMFPRTFRFGATTASYQNEGAWNEDGKGLGMWDLFVRIPGKVKNNATGDIACDSYHKYKEDVQILKAIGVQMYRFSIAWPRIMPDGTPNKINQKGIDHYLNVIKELKANGIEPLITIYHWDLPQHLLDLGGWLNPEIADYFADYARVVFQNFGPHVKYWVTINEPMTSCLMGYELGFHAPGLKLPGEGIYQCTYVQMLAHAKAYRIYDQEFRKIQQGKVTINVAGSWYYSKSPDMLDLLARDRAFAFELSLFADPVFKGNWPKLVIDRVANRSKLEGYSFSRLPQFTKKEIDLISGTYDFFSLNTYTSAIVSHISEPDIGSPSYTLDEATKNEFSPSWIPSASDWLYSDPPGIRHLLNHINEQYNPPEIIVTENGWSDLRGLDDQERIDYLKGYLGNILDAIIEDKVNVTGYTLWSLLDNFEWANGYTEKFGLIHVDFNSPNRTRTWKKSAKWYQKVIASRELN